MKNKPDEGFFSNDFCEIESAVNLVVKIALSAEKSGKSFIYNHSLLT